MLPVRFKNDLAKMDFTRVTATLLRWEDHSPLPRARIQRSAGLCWISDSTPVPPAVPRFSAVGAVSLLGVPAVSLLLSISEGMNCSSMGSQELKHCCQEPRADLGWIVA